MHKIINGVKIATKNKVYDIYFTENSGKIIYRDKIDTIIGIKHPGIILGDDIEGTTWVIHNHYKIGQPEIVTLQAFSLGAKTFYDNRTVWYHREEIVDRAIEAWKMKEKYHWLYNNCQHFVSEASQGKRKSETLNRIGNNLIAIGLGTGALGAAKKSKPLARVGLIVALFGFLIKLFSNL